MSDRTTGAEFFEPQRRIISQNNDDQRSNYLGMKGRISVASLLAHMATIAPHVKPEEMMLNFATVKWIDAATDEERAERLEWRRRNDERREAWERETWERLSAKYAGAS